MVVTNSLGEAGALRLTWADSPLPVPAPEERLIISTLQRMYRHFYLRLCDIADTAQLVESGAIDYVYLKSLAKSVGLWDGLAIILVMVSPVMWSRTAVKAFLYPRW